MVYVIDNRRWTLTMASVVRHVTTATVVHDSFLLAYSLVHPTHVEDEDHDDIMVNDMI